MIFTNHYLEFAGTKEQYAQLNYNALEQRGFPVEFLNQVKSKIQNTYMVKFIDQRYDSISSLLFFIDDNFKNSYAIAFKTKYIYFDFTFEKNHNDIYVFDYHIFDISLMKELNRVSYWSDFEEIEF